MNSSKEIISAIKQIVETNNVIKAGSRAHEENRETKRNLEQAAVILSRRLLRFEQDEQKEYDNV